MPKPVRPDSRFVRADEAITPYSCVVCGAEEWVELVEPHPRQSVRVDGVIEPRPLERRQCRGCGVGFRVSNEDLELMYRQDFSLYGNRPGADAFNRQRHPAVVDLIAGAIQPFRPRRILEVGCGDGSTLSAVRELWPEAETVGLEPSRRAAEAARVKGHRVIEGMVESLIGEGVEQHFDLIFSVQVIEHTADPVAFLTAQTGRLAAGGIVVTICPNGAVPHAELIHADHLFSFAPSHLAAVTARAGLIRRGGCEFFLDEAWEFNQLVVASKASESKRPDIGGMPAIEQDEVSRLEYARNAYLRRWSCLEDDLGERVGRCENLYCFGTGGWSSNLAAYAPAIWERVRACIVDNSATTTYMNKRVVDYTNLRKLEPEAVIVAVNPGRQDMVSRRLRGDGYRTIQWNDLIER